jgi:hypothetical protein
MDLQVRPDNRSRKSYVIGPGGPISFEATSSIRNEPNTTKTCFGLGGGGRDDLRVVRADPVHTEVDPPKAPRSKLRDVYLKCLGRIRSRTCCRGR